MLMSDTANEREVETDNSCVHGQQPWHQKLLGLILG